MNNDIILCPGGYEVTKEECDACGQCRPNHHESN